MRPYERRYIAGRNMARLKGNCKDLYWRYALLRPPASHSAAPSIGISLILAWVRAASKSCRGRQYKCSIWCFRTAFVTTVTSAVTDARGRRRPARDTARGRRRRRPGIAPTPANRRTARLTCADQARSRQASEHGRSPEPGLAQLRLAQGQVEAAGAMIFFNGPTVANDHAESSWPALCAIRPSAGADAGVAGGLPMRTRRLVRRPGSRPSPS